MSSFTQRGGNHQSRTTPLKPVLCQVTFGIYGRLTAACRSGYRLTVMGIGHVAGCKHPCNVCCSRYPFCLDVAGFIKREIGLEYVCIGLVSDGQEEPVYRQV